MKFSFLNNYDSNEGLVDEYFDNHQVVKTLYNEVFQKFHDLSHSDFTNIINSYKQSKLNSGLKSSNDVDSSKDPNKRFPFDLFPRIMDFEEWSRIKRGVVQRTQALNLFITDVYNDQKILKDNVVPGHLVRSAPHYLKAVEGKIPPKGVYNHISGYDLIKHSDASNYILEDNFRFPSGVSDALMTRSISKEYFSSTFEKWNILSVDAYAENLLNIMREVSPFPKERPFCILLSQGPGKSVYFKHSYLAKQLNIELVERNDLFVENENVYLKKADGQIRVDVIYRRIGDEFLDPLGLDNRRKSLAKSFLNSYLKGNVSIINAPGSGIGDDKAIYDYVPQIIKYYLNEEAIIPNIQTYVCDRVKDLEFVLQNLPDLVIKPVDKFGGTGVKVCNRLSTKELEALRIKIRANPREYVAQPIMDLSTHMTYIEENCKFEPRHIDLRSLVLLGNDTSYVYPGGLTRVAYKKGSLIVNTSCGGGFKDTWVVKSPKVK